MLRLGVVSFLNSRPLIQGLSQRPDLQLLFDVPAALPDRLAAGDVDVALLPIVDVLRRGDACAIVSNACIGADGETMTVRIFAQTPPHRIRTLWVDGDSHTSVALAQVLWGELHDTTLDVRPLAEASSPLDQLDAVLLIGDKVMDPRRAGFAYEVDLGGAWRAHTGLPFVFAVWARRADTALPAADSILSTARDAGVARAAQIAAEEADAHGWSVPAAERHLVRCLRYRLDARAVEGADLFGRLCAKHGVVAQEAPIRWPEVVSSAAGATS